MSQAILDSLDAACRALDEGIRTTIIAPSNCDLVVTSWVEAQRTAANGFRVVPVEHADHVALHVMDRHGREIVTVCRPVAGRRAA